MKRLLAYLGMFMVASTLIMASSAGISEAAPCVQSAFPAYIGLGSTGCELDDKRVFDFGYSPAGPNAPAVGSVNVIPDTSNPNNPMLHFQAGWSAVTTQAADSLIEYTIATVSGAPLIVDNSLAINGVGATGTGLVTVAENKCLGGNWVGGVCSSGLTSNLFVFFDSTPPNITSVTDTFPAVSSIDVIKNITVLGGADGAAALSLVSQGFSQVAPNGVPAPLSLLLVGAGLAGAALWGRRRRS
jgi:hypothetical protein